MIGKEADIESDTTRLRSLMHLLSHTQEKECRMSQHKLIVVFFHSSGGDKLKIKICGHFKMQLWQRWWFTEHLKGLYLNWSYPQRAPYSSEHCVDSCTYTDLELVSSETFSSCAKNCLSKGTSGWPDSVKTNRAEFRSGTFCSTVVIGYVSKTAAGIILLLSHEHCPLSDQFHKLWKGITTKTRNM